MRKGAKGLGRGLHALIPDSALDIGGQDAANDVHRIVPIDEIRPNPEQPRDHFDAEELRSLSASIERFGILQPLTVRRHEGRYVIIAGERRFRAAGLAGLTEVPVIVREADSGREQLELALVENLQRADLDAVEEAKGYQRLLDEYTYTQEEVARAVGKNRSTIANAVRLLRLPDFGLEALREGRISAGHARALLALRDEEDLRRALAQVIAKELSVRATERLVSEMTRPSAPARAKRVREKNRAMEFATKLLRNSLQTGVSIKPPTRKGSVSKIVVEYADDEDLQRLIELMRADQ